MCAASGYEKYWFSRLTRMMRHGKPVPGTHWLFWYRPRQTPVAPFQSRSKSETLTAVPAFVFHHRSAVGSVGGNFVYWIVSRISPLNLSGGGRIWPMVRPPRPRTAPTAPAVTPTLTQSRRVQPFSLSSFSQLIEASSSERSRQDDFRPSNLVYQLVRHELFAIDFDREGEQEEDHPHEQPHVRCGLGVRNRGDDLQPEHDGQAADERT